MICFKFRRILDFIYFNLFKPGRNGKLVKNPIAHEFIVNILSVADNSKIQKIIPIRNEYLCDNRLLEINDFGAGSKHDKGKFRKVSNIARISGSSLKKCTLLYQITAHYKPEIIVELGTSLGLGTMSLAMGNEEAVVYTLEGSKELYSIASDNFKKNNFFNVRPICGKFNEVLPPLFDELKAVDLIFIDGNHTYEATMRYYNLVLKFLKPGSLIIFDDIRWSAGMFSAWQDICSNKNTKMALDLFDTGIVFKSDIIKREYFRIYY